MLRKDSVCLSALSKWECSQKSFLKNWGKSEVTITCSFIHLPNTVLYICYALGTFLGTRDTKDTKILREIILYDKTK